MKENFRSLDEIIKDLQNIDEDLDNPAIACIYAEAIKDLKLIAKHCLGYEI